MKTTAVLMIILSFLLVVWWPIAVIWAINTLFRTEIPVNIQTWIATALLVSLFKVNLEGYSKK